MKKLTGLVQVTKSVNKFRAKGRSAKSKREAAINAEEREARRLEASAELRQFLEGCCGSTLRAWLNVFDIDNDQRVNKFEFNEGMRHLGYQGKIPQLFADLDDDGSGELTMPEIDPDQASVWTEFRSFCVEHFKSVDLMMERLSDVNKVESNKKAPCKVEKVTESEFTQNLKRMGWSGGGENLLFSALRAEESGAIDHSRLRWLGIELKRRTKKALARAKHSSKRQKRSDEGQELFHDFKAYLKKKYGNLVRAWRTVFRSNETMILPKPAFLKACAAMGFATNAKTLWTVLDKDNSGFASLDELDPQSALVLAEFKLLIDNKFSSVHDAFVAIDLEGKKKITAKQFDDALKRYGWIGPTKQLFVYMDNDSRKILQPHDFNFLEKWIPFPFLLVGPNEIAMEEVKALILQRYSNMLKAWRHLMDKDGSNRVNWAEFSQVCKILGYRGDAPGAWRAFDSDLSGYITLEELDPVANKFLMDFRNWCRKEFGTVKSAFSVFDEDGSNSLTFEEFRGACRIYGYTGHYRKLFDSCDINQEGTLSLKEVAFLDEWEVKQDKEEHQVFECSGTFTNVSVSKQKSEGYSIAEREGKVDFRRTFSEDPLRTLNVVRVKQLVQNRSFSKLPRMLESTSIKAAETSRVPKGPPLSARTPRYCEERKDRERKRWRITDPCQREQFWDNYRAEELADQQEFEDAAEEPLAATSQEEPAPATYALKPTLDELLRLPRFGTSTVRVSHKGRSQGQKSKSVGRTTTGFSNFPRLGCMTAAALPDAAPMSMTAR